MDPNATLVELRKAITAAYSAETDSQAMHAHNDVVRHAEALDEWMTRGGFTPTAWCTEQSYPV